MPPAAVAGVLTASILAINVLLHKPVLDALLFSLAIAVGITPQLLPAVVSTAGTIQRALDRLTYGMTALLTPAQQPIPLHDAIAKAGGTSFLLMAAGRQPDETKAASYFRSAAGSRTRSRS